METKGRKRNRKKSSWVTDGEWNSIKNIAIKTGMRIGVYRRASTPGKWYKAVQLYRKKKERNTIMSKVCSTINLSHFYERGRCLLADRKKRCRI